MKSVVCLKKDMRVQCGCEKAWLPKQPETSWLQSEWIICPNLSSRYLLEILQRGAMKFQYFCTEFSKVSNLWLYILLDLCMELSMKTDGRVVWNSHSTTPQRTLLLPGLDDAPSWSEPVIKFNLLPNFP